MTIISARLPYAQKNILPNYQHISLLNYCSQYDIKVQEFHKMTAKRENKWRYTHSDVTIFSSNCKKA